MVLVRDVGELTEPNSCAIVGDVQASTWNQIQIWLVLVDVLRTTQEMYASTLFWFDRNPGVALPLSANITKLKLLLNGKADANMIPSI